MQNDLFLDLSFDDWINHVFAHPVTDPAWYWALDADTRELDEATGNQFLCQLFSTSAATLSQFSDGQVNQGLWYLISEACSSYIYSILSQKLEKDQRLKLIELIPDVFRDLFAERCAPVLCNLDEPGGTELNPVCYMWWDLFPTWGTPKDLSMKDTDLAFIETMRDILTINHIACQESALHGLGHWHLNYPEITSAIVDDYLQANPCLRPELRRYAESALIGCVQ